MGFKTKTKYLMNMKHYEGKVPQNTPVESPRFYNSGPENDIEVLWKCNQNVGTLNVDTSLASNVIVQHNKKLVKTANSDKTPNSKTLKINVTNLELTNDQPVPSNALTNSFGPIPVAFRRRTPADKPSTPVKPKRKDVISSTLGDRLQLNATDETKNEFIEKEMAKLNSVIKLTGNPELFTGNSPVEKRIKTLYEEIKNQTKRLPEINKTVVTKPKSAKNSVTKLPSIEIFKPHDPVENIVSEFQKFDANFRDYQQRYETYLAEDEIVSLTNGLFTEPVQTEVRRKEKISTDLPQISFGHANMQDINQKTEKFVAKLDQLNEKITNLQQEYLTHKKETQYLKNEISEKKGRVQLGKKKKGHGIYKSVADYESSLNEKLSNFISKEEISKGNESNEELKNEEIRRNNENALFYDLRVSNDPNCTAEKFDCYEKSIDFESLSNLSTANGNSEIDFFLEDDNTMYTSSGLMISTVYDNREKLEKTAKNVSFNKKKYNAFHSNDESQPESFEEINPPDNLDQHIHKSCNTTHSETISINTDSTGHQIYLTPRSSILLTDIGRKLSPTNLIQQLECNASTRNENTVSIPNESENEFNSELDSTSRDKEIDFMAEFIEDPELLDSPRIAKSKSNYHLAKKMNELRLAQEANFLRKENQRLQKENEILSKKLKVENVHKKFSKINERVNEVVNRLASNEIDILSILKNPGHSTIKRRKRKPLVGVYNSLFKTTSADEQLRVPKLPVIGKVGKSQTINLEAWRKVNAVPQIDQIFHKSEIKVPQSKYVQFTGVNKRINT